MICPICERDCPDKFMSAHHLRTRKADKWLTEMLCRDCHKYIHALFTNKELADKNSDLHTIEGLMAREEFAKAVKFIRTIPPGRKVSIYMSNDRWRRSGRKKGRRGEKRP